MLKKKTITGDYGDIGRGLARFVTEDLKAAPPQSGHLLMVMEHLQTAFAEEKGVERTVSISADMEARKLTFSVS